MVMMDAFLEGDGSIDFSDERATGRDKGGGSHSALNSALAPRLSLNVRNISRLTFHISRKKGPGSRPPRPFPRLRALPQDRMIGP